MTAGGHLLGNRAARVALVVLAVVFCLVPSPGGVVLTGLPLSAVDILAIGATLLAFGLCSLEVTVRKLVAVGALIVLKVLVTGVVLTPGWRATYFPNSEFRHPIAESTQFRASTFTRVDERLAFHGSDFPLFFFNETGFNFTSDRRAPGFSVRWVGLLRVDTPREYVFRVVSASVRTSLVIDERTLIGPGSESPLNGGIARVAQPLKVGSHRLLVTYVAEPFSPRSLGVSVAVRTSSGTERPALIYPVEVSATAERISDLGRVLVAIVDVLFFGLLVVWCVGSSRSRPKRSLRDGVVRAFRAATMSPSGLSLFIFFVGTLVVLVYYGWEVPVRHVFIQSGNDGLAYEAYARRTLLGDWLHRAGDLAGKPYLYMVGYPLYLSAMHLLFGEGLTAVVFAQQLLFVASIAMATGTAYQLFGRQAAIWAAAIGVVFWIGPFWPTTYIFRENLVVFLDLALFYIAAATNQFSTRRAVLLGLVLGVNCLTDAINVVLIPMVIGWAYVASPRNSRVRHAVILGAACAVVVGVVPLRNWIVTGWPTLLPTEGPPTLWWGNRPPAGLPDHAVEGDYYQVIWNYLRSEPLHFLGQMWRKTLYSLGFYSLTFGPYPDFLQFSVFPLLFLPLSAVSLVPRVRVAPSAMLIAAAGLIKWATIVVFVADHNVDRYEITLCAMLIPAVAGGLDLLWRSSRTAVAVIVTAVALNQWAHVLPALGNYSFSSAVNVMDPSYLYRRQRDLVQLGRMQTEWSFPRDPIDWTRGDSFVPVPAAAPIFQLLHMNSGGGVSTPDLRLPASLVQYIELDAAFTGWPHAARFLIVTAEKRTPGFVYFPVDPTGTMRTYRIPVYRAADWSGTVSRLDLYYAGDEIRLRRLKLRLYPDVENRRASQAR